MKKFIRWAVVVLVGALLAGCGRAEDTAKRNANGTQNVKDLLNAEESKALASKESPSAQDLKGSSSAQSSEESETKTNTPLDISEAPVETSALKENETGSVDVDLAALSSTMVYSEVYNMMMTPDNYLGKTIKMKGVFSYFKDDNTGNEYFSCIIQDATACCAQGIEFVLEGDPKYPEDYPQQGAEITVVGIFDTYYEGQYRYCTLRSATMTP